MKVRLGFVSNSSSSSFILKNAADVELAKTYGMIVYKVEDILNNIKQLRDYASKLPIPDFMRYDCCDYQYETELIHKLQLLYETNPACYITGKFDRSVAYNLNVYFEILEGDL